MLKLDNKRITKYFILLLIVSAAIGQVPIAADEHPGCHHHHCCDDACLCACPRHAVATLVSFETVVTYLPQAEGVVLLNDSSVQPHLIFSIFRPPEQA
ncbi:MAG TPA: hypothetical protein PLU88_04175 [Armatimonadota bacterium]|nr:hypothetical protein [Armatimonadota bacterium]HPP74307.1 hypothetical protein [Armatimonadota bacterium]